MFTCYLFIWILSVFFNFSESRCEQIMDKDQQQELKEENDDEEENVENLYGLHNYEDSDSEMEETGFGSSRV